MAGDLAHSEVLHFRSRVLADHLVRPQVPNLNQLVLSCDNTQVFQTEREILLGCLTPVHDSGNGMATGDLRGIDLRQPPERVPFAAAKIACCLLSLGVLIHGNQILVLQDIDGGLRGN